MSGYTKLSSSIVNSSIWDEPDHTRIVWITMLALADQDGIVRASLGGLAHAARVDRESTKKAIDVLMSPDEDSTNPDHDGRRVERIDGGWHLLNHHIYRQMGTSEDRRHEWRERKRKQRMSQNVPECPGQSVNTGYGTGTGNGLTGGESKKEDGTYLAPPPRPRDDGDDAVVPDVEPPVAGEVKKWMDTAFDAFPDAGPPTLPEREKVRGHVAELIAAGKSWDLFDEVAYWVKHAPYSHAKFKPKDAAQLANPQNWTMWVSHMRETDFKFEEEKRRKRR